LLCCFVVGEQGFSCCRVFKSGQGCVCASVKFSGLVHAVSWQKKDGRAVGLLLLLSLKCNSKGECRFENHHQKMKCWCWFYDRKNAVFLMFFFEAGPGLVHFVNFGIIW
jgi:hypothetical protein